MNIYRKSSKETCGSYSFSEGPNAGLIRIWPEFVHFCLLFLKFSACHIRTWVLFEDGSPSRIFGTQNCQQVRAENEGNMGIAIASSIFTHIHT